MQGKIEGFNDSQSKLGAMFLSDDQAQLETCYVSNMFPTFSSRKTNFSKSNFTFTSCRLQDQAQRQLKKGGKFEDVSAGECRPSALVERYDNLYTQTRLDALDELDELESLDKLDDNGDIKNKILFSVVVVSEILDFFQIQ